MSTRCAIAVFATILFCVSASGGEDQNTGPVVDGAKAKSFVAHLSTDAMEGRMTCTDGYRKAADWVAARFSSWGLQPAGEDGTYFQNITIRGRDWNTGVPTLKVGSRQFPFDDGDYSVNPESTPGIAKQADVVFVGYGISAPDKNLDEYEGVNVKGKIVLAFTGSPKDAPELQRRFQREEESKEENKEKEKQEEWKEESTDLSKIQLAYDKGAAAIMLRDPNEPSDSDNRRRRSSRRSGPPSFRPERDFLAFTIRERVFRAIMKRDAQESPSGLKRRMDQIRREIKQKNAQSGETGVKVALKGYDVSIRIDEKQGNNVARNVLAKIKGTDPKLKDQYVMVGAHLDHIGVRDGFVCNGADDNASGSAVVLEIARVLAQHKFQPKRTLIFCCWTGEELGLIGSTHYTNHPCDDVSMDRVVTYFNLDMVGMGENLGASGALNFPAIWDVIRRDQDPEIIKHVKPRQGGPGGSDHTPFIKRGIEALMLMSSGGVGHQDYHQPEDDTEKIEPEMLRLSGQFVLQGMMNLANESKTKLLIDRRQQTYRAMRMTVRNFNPDLSESQWSRVQLQAKTKEALDEGIYNRTRELLKGKSASGTSGGGGQASGQQARPKPSLARGLSDLKLFGDDPRTLRLVLDLYSIGRVDIKGDDGQWVAEGRLTEEGKDALKALEEENVVVRLVSPSEKLLTDMLSAASKPFIVTGDYEITYAMTDRLNARGVLLGIDFDPKDVKGFLGRLEQAKEQLGERSNLFAFLTNAEGLDEAKKPLYLGLVDHGWTHSEICGGREHRGLVGGARLNTLGGGR